MGLECFKFIFGLSSCDFWPTLEPRQPIPDRLKSAQATSNRPSKLGLGFAEAVGFLLTGRVTLGRFSDRLSVQYESNQGGRRLASTKTSGNSLHIWQDANTMKAPAFLAIAEAMLLDAGAFAESRARWESLLDDLKRELGARARRACRCRRA